MMKTKAMELDIRPIFARGGSPCSTIDDAVAGLRDGQDQVLLAPFEPVPLYAKLEAQGFSHDSRELEDGTWRIEFRRTGPARAAASVRCGCSGHD